jgi:hypothetical protein
MFKCKPNTSECEYDKPDLTGRRRGHTKYGNRLTPGVELGDNPTLCVEIA